MISPVRPYVVLYKQLGQTPLQAIEAWKEANPAYAGMPATYAGRLDPMAEGILLVLLGEECKGKDSYLELCKEYEIEVLLDLATDTGDALGLSSYTDTHFTKSEQDIRTALNAVAGSHEVPYPAYSSKTVHGKPLFQYALEGSLDDIEIPTHTETIHRIRHTGSTLIRKEELEARILDLLSHAPRSDEPSKQLGADFRQNTIRAAWTSLFDSLPDREFMLLRLCVTAASGTYMRTLASRIARELGTTGMTLSIRRTKIGSFRSLLGQGVWTKQYR